MTASSKRHLRSHLRFVALAKSANYDRFLGPQRESAANVCNTSPSIDSVNVIAIEGPNNFHRKY
jgi:hypothetical protein